jgi:hypothetical protein
MCPQRLTEMGRRCKVYWMQLPTSSSRNITKLKKCRREANPPPTITTKLVAVGRSRRVNAASCIVHRASNLAAQGNRRDRNRRTDNRQNERIFGGRSAALVAKHVDELDHCPSPYCNYPPVHRTDRDVSRRRGQTKFATEKSKQKFACPRSHLERPPGRSTEATLCLP